jgi:hypothetical protein
MKHEAPKTFGQITIAGVPIGPPAPPAGWKGHENLMSRVLMSGRWDISSQNARLGPELVIVVKRHVVQQGDIRR